MYELKFKKMHGCGNDYIFFDCLNMDLKNPNEISKLLSDRHFGIGGDGIVLICKSEVADAKMRMFNADGSEGRMCGNALRCVGKFLFDGGIVSKKNISIETLSGIKLIKILYEEDNKTFVRAAMGLPVFIKNKIPVCLKNGENLEKIISYPLELNDGKIFNITAVSVGNPHCVIFVNDLTAVEFEKYGPKIENHSMFPDRTNVEFVELVNDKKLRMRVWERGSGETFACGTGACASVVAAIANGFCNMNEDIEVLVRGGILIVRSERDETFLSGEAVEVFSGVVKI